MFSIINKSLKIKFSLIIACVLLVIFTIASLYLINQSSSFQKESLLSNDESYGQLATKPLGDAYDIYHDSGLFKLEIIFQNTLKLNNTIPRIQVISVNGEVLFDTDDMKKGLPGSVNLSEERIVDNKLLQIIDGNTQTDIKDAQNNITEIISPYSDEFGGRPYSLRYFISYDSINASIMQAVRTTIILNIMLFLFTFIAVMYLVNRSILTPLEKLTILAKAIGHGEFDYSVSIKTGDELEQLATDYEIMANNLKKETMAITAEKDTLSLVLSNIADGVIALDSLYNVLFFNQIAPRILRLNTELVVGKELDQMLSLTENNKAVTIKELCQLSVDKPTFHSLSFYSKDNQEKKIHVIVAPLQHSTGFSIAYMVTFYDLTKEEEFEKMKLDFVSMAAHELRTPLTAVRGYLSFLQDQVATKLTTEELSYLQRSIVGSEQLYALIENLLNISKIEQGKMNIHIVPVSLEKIIEPVVATLQPYAREQNNINLIFEKPENALPQISADVFLINEVLTNLISNAINFNRPDGWIKVAVKQKDDYLTVSVSDGGKGIAATAIPHLFTKFYRVTAPLQMGSKGTGLGLYISKKIIDAHNGKIWVQSEVDKGTTFFFTLKSLEKTN